MTHCQHLEMGRSSARCQDMEEPQSSALSRLPTIGRLSRMLCRLGVLARLRPCPKSSGSPRHALPARTTPAWSGLAVEQDTAALF